MRKEFEPEVAPVMTSGATKVLAAATDLFYREGIHAVGVDAIAAAAGVTKKTLYDRFGSKDALAVAYLRGRDERWRAYLAAGLEKVPAGTIERVLAVFDITDAWARENLSKGCGAINARAEFEGMGHPIASEAIRQKKWMRELLADLCRVADADGMADTLMLLHEGGLVTGGMGTFEKPYAVARGAAEQLLRVSADE
jgi:AcrR family transcriptional regulator